MSSYASSENQGGTRSDVPIAMLAALIAVASIAYVMKQPAFGTPQVATTAMAFTALIAVGEMFRVRLPNDRVAAPVASAFAAAFALLLQFGPGDSGQMHYGVAVVVVVTTAGAALGTLGASIGQLVRRRETSSMQLEEVSRRILSIFAVAVVFRPLALHLLDHTPGASPSVVMTGGGSGKGMVMLAALMLAAAVVGTTVDVILVALSRSSRLSSPLDRSLKDEFRESLPIGVPITSSAVLMALAAPWLGWWALGVFAMPVLLSQFAYSRYARVVGTNEGTIRALARVTELGGYTELQHADRVAELSRLTGLQLGLSSKEQLALERAALMHDIGQLALAEAIPGGRIAPGTPFIPGGATILLALDEQRDLAEKGAAIIRDTQFLDDVAVIVERQVDPYRARGGVVDETIPMASRIIKVANAFDDLVGGSLEADRRLQALARLREGSGYEYDPDVVDVVTGIVSPRRA